MDDRTPGVRRDLNDLIRSPDGKVSEAKVFAVLFKCCMLWVFIFYAPSILSNWEVLSAFVVAMLAPDLLKKLLSMRAGVSDGESRTTTYKRESTSTSTVAEAKE